MTTGNGAMAMSDEQRARYHQYLNELRDSGRTNMFGAAPFPQRRFEDSMEYALFARAYETLVERVGSVQRREGREEFTAVPGAMRATGRRARSEGCRGDAGEIEDREELARVQSYVEASRALATAASVYGAMRRAGVPTCVLGCKAHRRWVRRCARSIQLRRRAGLALVGVGGLMLVAYAASAEAAIAVVVVP